jgi:hypothetical protein
MPLSIFVNTSRAQGFHLATRQVHPLERLETFLKDEPDKRRRALSKRGRGRGAIKQAPISMLAGEPYEDPRDFTLDLKVNEPLENGKHRQHMFMVSSLAPGCVWYSYWQPRAKLGWSGRSGREGL